MHESSVAPHTFDRLFCIATLLRESYPTWPEDFVIGAKSG